jgi:hypothetical protein
MLAIIRLQSEIKLFLVQPASGAAVGGLAANRQHDSWCTIFGAGDTDSGARGVLRKAWSEAHRHAFCTKILLKRRKMQPQTCSQEC